MEYLEDMQFSNPGDLVRWVNKNNVRVVSITEGEELFTLFFKRKLD